MNSDNRVNSQQSLDRRNNHLVEDPGVKELLSTCAKYNLDQGVSGMEGGYPAEILDEIRQAESLRSSSSPHSPVKDKDQEGPSSPPPLPQPPPIIATNDRQQAWIYIPLLIAVWTNKIETGIHTSYMKRSHCIGIYILAVEHAWLRSAQPACSNS